MKQTLLSQLLLYRYRYKAGYLFFTVLLLGVIGLAVLSGHQLTSDEQTSAVQSATLSLTDPTSASIVDAPYHLLQKATLHFFGITVLAIKLPSLLIALATGIGIFFLMRRWLMRPSIALLASLIAITTAQFLSTGATGTPLIMPIFWMTALILIIVQLASRPHSLWLYVAFALFAGLSLYTPLSVYLLLSVVLTTVLHPRLRFLLRKAPPSFVSVSFLIGLVTVAPLIIAITKNSDILLELMGWPAGLVSRAQIKHNIIELLKAYFVFWKPHITAIGLTPLFGMSALILIILGGLKLVASHYTARSYQLALLLPLLIIPVILQPSYVVILFIPLIMLMALGIEVLMDEWYRLFPHNPYARVTVLVPVAILLGGMIVANFNHYQDSYRYSADLPHYYTRDLSLARQLLEKYPTATIVTAASQEPFFNLLQRDYPTSHASQELVSGSPSQPVIVTSGSGGEHPPQKNPHFIVVDEYKDRTPRFYVYTD